MPPQEENCCFWGSFFTFNGNYPIGNEILTHLEKMMMKKRMKTFLVDEIAKKSYNCNPHFAGAHNVYWWSHS